MAAYGFSAAGRPGIFSTYPQNCTALEGCSILDLGGCGCVTRTTFKGDNRFAYLQGTSMATPQVSGAVGLVRALRPRLSAHRVITVLKRTAAGGGYTSQRGWGILDAGAAVKYARAHYNR
jgi:subtilisin family serine protease